MIRRCGKKLKRRQFIFHAIKTGQIAAAPHYPNWGSFIMKQQVQRERERAVLTNKRYWWIVALIIRGLEQNCFDDIPHIRRTSRQSTHRGKKFYVVRNECWQSRKSVEEAHSYRERWQWYFTIRGGCLSSPFAVAARHPTFKALLSFEGYLVSSLHPCANILCFCLEQREKERERAAWKLGGKRSNSLESKVAWW